MVSDIKNPCVEISLKVNISILCEEILRSVLICLPTDLNKNLLYTLQKLRDAFKKKTDLRTLSQKVGGGPDQIPKFVVCEIGT